MNRVTVNLNPSSNNINGTFDADDEVLVLCDCTNGDFSIVMPDVQSSDDNLFRFVKKDSTLNTVTLTAKPGQKIMGEDTQILTEQHDELVLSSNGIEWY